MFWRDRILPGLRRRGYARRKHRTNTAGSRRIIERLESRQLLTANLMGGVLTVPGTTGNDTILIAVTSNGASVQVTINNKIDSTFDLSTVNQININADNGNDLITVKGIDKLVDVDGGAGVNQVNIIGHAGSNNFVLDTTSVSVNSNSYTFSPATIQRLSVNGQNANDKFTVQNLPLITTVIDGGGGLNTLQGPNADTEWDITVSNGGTIKNSLLRFGNIQSLMGGVGNDSFVFSAGRSISSSIDGGTGTDSISFANFTTPVTVNLQTDSAIGLGRFLDIDSIIGGAGKDTIVGPNSSNTWSIGTGGVVTIDNTGTNFTGFENLTGGTQDDTFYFADSASIPGRIDGGLGKNTLNYSEITTLVIVSAANLTRIQMIQGPSSAHLELLGPAVNSTWNINGPNSGTVGGISFSNVDTLTGGTKNDTFLFTSTAAKIDGAIDGGPGSNVLNYSSFSAPVTVNLTIGAIADFSSIIATNGQSNTLIGFGGPNTWKITGGYSGNINGTLSFNGFNKLTGGSSDDTFVMTKGVNFAGIIDGGDITSINTLDYSTYTTGINVDLGTGIATNIAGGVAEITDVLGGSGNDVLTGSSSDNLLRGNNGNDIINGMGGNDILVGGPGDDSLTGGDGRDLIMGGLGQDNLSGGGGEDILISGTTTFDNNGTTQAAILKFWEMDSVTSTVTISGSTSTVTTPLPFATRVAELRAGTTGDSTIPPLNATNVRNDVSIDTLAGGTVISSTDDNLDWFFANLSGSPRDTITDFSAAESFN
jgi:hypothetical protein